MQIQATQTTRRRIVYRPAVHQWDFHRARELGYTVRWLCAGVGSGKTYAAVMEDYILATVVDPGAAGLIVVPDYQVFDQVVAAKIREIWPVGTYAIRNTKHGIVIYVASPKGISPIFVRSAHNAQAVAKIIGLQVAWVHFEEIAEAKQLSRAWINAHERMRDVSAPYVGAHVASTPRPGPLPRLMGIQGGLPPEARQPGGYSPRPGYWIRQAGTADNAANLAPGTEERLRDLLGDSDLARQELDGEIVSGRGKVYQIHRGIHVISADAARRLTAPDRGPRGLGGIDFGYYPSAGAAISGAWVGDMLIVTGEWYHTRRQIQEQGAWCHQHEYPGHLWYADSAEPRSIDLLRAGWDWEGRRWSGLRVLPAVKHDWLASTNVLQALFSRRPGLHPVTGADWRPGILISDACPNLIRELEDYRVDENFMDLDQQPNSKTECIGDDHAIDALRYMVYSDSVRTETRTWGRRDSPDRRLW